MGGFCDECMSLEDIVKRTFDFLLSLRLRCRHFLYRLLANRFSLLFSTGFQVGRHHSFFCPNAGALMLYSSISFKELISFGFSLMLRQFTPLKQFLSQQDHLFV